MFAAVNCLLADKTRHFSFQALIGNPPPIAAHRFHEKNNKAGEQHESCRTPVKLENNIKLEDSSKAVEQQ